MKHYADRSPLALEYCVIKLTQKERELKFDGRFFGSSPYVERARRCILESNVADVMDQYNLSQAMTLDELKKFSKMYTLSKLSETNPEYHLLFISIHVEGWNNSFRRPFCEPIGQHLFDSIFGTDQFKCFMDIYELSNFI
jgi:hypothetical protein